MTIFIFRKKSCFLLYVVPVLRTNRNHPMSKWQNVQTGYYINWVNSYVRRKLMNL